MWRKWCAKPGALGPGRVHFTTKEPCLKSETNVPSSATAIGWRNLGNERSSCRVGAQSKALASSVGPSDRLVWALSHQPHAEESWESVGLSLGVGTLTRFAKTSTPLRVLDKNWKWADRSTAPRQHQGELDLARQRLGLLEAMEPVDAWTEEDVMDAIQQWKGIAVELAQTLELDAGRWSFGVRHRHARRGTQRRLAGSGWPLQTTSALPNAWMHLPWIGSNRDVCAELATLLWLAGCKRETTPSASWMLKDVVSRSVGAQRQKGGLGIRSSVCSLSPAKQFAKGPFECPADHEERPSSGGGATFCHSFAGENAPSLLTATWVLSLWTQSPEWQALSPDQVVAMIPEVPRSLSPVLQDMRVVWARQTREMDEEVEPTPEDAFDNPDEDLSDVTRNRIPDLHG